MKATDKPLYTGQHYTVRWKDEHGRNQQQTLTCRLCAASFRQQLAERQHRGKLQRNPALYKLRQQWLSTFEGHAAHTQDEQRKCSDPLLMHAPRSHPKTWKPTALDATRKALAAYTPLAAYQRNRTIRQFLKWLHQAGQLAAPPDALLAATPHPKYQGVQSNPAPASANRPTKNQPLQSRTRKERHGDHA